LILLDEDVAHALLRAVSRLIATQSIVIFGSGREFKGYCNVNPMISKAKWVRLSKFV